MDKDSNWLIHDHRKYDAALDECEMAAGAGDWKHATRLFEDFVEDLKLHMRMEDEVLYPLFLEESGDEDGEIALLGDEHDNLVRLLSDLIYVIKTKDFDHFEESLAPLHKAMIEHSEHEEVVFLSLGSDSVLLQRDEIMARMASLKPDEQLRNWGF